ncbi:hypothetical protein V494_01915, partial [Pseudogymnoascus sp. VKM F-4513 (FW-928)]
MRATPYGHRAARAVLDECGACDEGVEVAESRGAVGVGEDGVGAADVAEAVGYGATFAAVVGQGDDAEGVVEGVGVGEAEGGGDGGVGGAVVYEEDFVALGGLGFRFGFGGGGWGGGTTVGRVEVGDCFFEHGFEARFFVVGGDYDAHCEGGGFDVPGVFGGGAGGAGGP